jgi:hypothetical protein
MGGGGDSQDPREKKPHEYPHRRNRPQGATHVRKYSGREDSSPLAG